MKDWEEYMGPPSAVTSRKIQTDGDRAFSGDEEVDFRAIRCESLLDSGASLASLYMDDLEEMGIRRDSYGALMVQHSTRQRVH